MKKVLVAMSGGVDSSVAAFLLKNQGYDCIGCTMKLFMSDEVAPMTEKSCCSLNDVEDARSVAYRLNMPYYVFNLSDHFRKTVIEPFVESYQHGHTPNPCINCNRYLKFDKLYERARILSCDAIATGHYARISFDGHSFHLLKAYDSTKDQTYMLYSMTQEQLSRTIFPLGEITKQDTRRLAAANGFYNAKKPDSQDICFVPDGDYAAFIERFTGKRFPEGNYLYPDGSVAGRHRGIIHYTVGQRRGLGIASSSPLYVSSINPEENTVTITEESGLMIDTVYIGNVNMISGVPLQKSLRVSAKLRYRQPERPAVAEQNGEILILHFDVPQRSPAPGQAAVLYVDDEVIGGGTILYSKKGGNTP